MTSHGDRNSTYNDGYSSKERDRDLSLDGQSAQNIYMGNVKNAHRGREDSEAKENNYFIASNTDKDRVSIGFDQSNFENQVNPPSINQMSPRMRNQEGTEIPNIQRMNVMNFLDRKQKNDRSDRDKSSDSRFLAPINQEYQKVINRQGSKKLIQGSHLMNMGHPSMAGQQVNQFPSNKMNFVKNAKPVNSGYEYDINLPQPRRSTANDGIGSNSGSVVGNPHI